jgi:hypothetical protein
VILLYTFVLQWKMNFPDRLYLVDFNTHLLPTHLCNGTVKIYLF